MNKVFVRYISMPVTVKGAIVTDADGNYNMYINSDLSPKARRAAYEHEYNHLRNNDFYNEDEICIIEERADIPDNSGQKLSL